MAVPDFLGGGGLTFYSIVSHISTHPFCGVFAQQHNLNLGFKVSSLGKCTNGDETWNPALSSGPKRGDGTTQLNAPHRTTPPPLLWADPAPGGWGPYPAFPPLPGIDRRASGGPPVPSPSQSISQRRRRSRRGCCTPWALGRSTAPPGIRGTEWYGTDGRANRMISNKFETKVCWTQPALDVYLF